uniref:protein-tyrosine-phosphatase n=6 Tax=Onchocerca TaxID=6281 RepID=A0A8R1XRT8_ONCVO
MICWKPTLAERTAQWLWWSTLIFLLLRATEQLRVQRNIANKSKNDNVVDKKMWYSENISAVPLKSQPKTPSELKIPECEDSINDCAYGGKCVADVNGYKSCLCPASCPASYCIAAIPVSCRAGKHDDYCMSMSDDYRDKYLLPEPACYMGICICPPMFDPWRMEGAIELLPFKCDRRELMVQGRALPSDSVYQGADASLFCCINMDPRSFVDDDGNSSIIREPTNTPYDEIFTDGIEPPRCWSLEIKNAQYSDSGTYLCHVKTTGKHEINTNHTINFFVKDQNSLSTREHSKLKFLDLLAERRKAKKIKEKTPRIIQNVTVKTNATHAEIQWDAQDDGPMLKIDFKLMRRTDGVEVWSDINAKSGMVIGELLPATPYTLFISVFDGQNEPFKITEHFTTSESAPEPPTLGEIRVLNLQSGLYCEVEWMPPKTPNGRITKYYVTVRGQLRHVSPGGILSNDDFPAEEKNQCVNYINNDSSYTSADAIADFYSCRFGPLKPNRNYTSFVWAENSAGRSENATFSEQCITDFAQPDAIDAPASLSQNGTIFSLTFSNEPDEVNGPVACYYVAIVPLAADVVIESLPPPDSLIVDTFLKTMSNNLQSEQPKQDTKQKRYFAYIAESYMQYPKRTFIGDGNTTAGVESCNVLYLSRHRPEDPALRPGLKYTGFLIARVDRDHATRDESFRHNDPFFLKRKRRRLYQNTEKRFLDRSRWFSYRENSEFSRHFRLSRQLIVNGPAYGFSGYFKPIILEAFDEQWAQSWMVLLFSVLSLILFIMLVSSFVTYVLHRHGMIKLLCPMSKDRILLKPHFHAILIDDLPEEYAIRRRDSNYLCISEFDALPNYRSMESSASERLENAHKNRYNDIKAFDATRVKLSIIGNDPSTDYINANFVKGYKSRKMFIASQGPLDASTDDFWRMIWEHKVRVIVMVANLYERNRCQCAKYWPDDGPKVYDKLEVHPVDSIYYSDYAIRSFEVRRIQSTVASGSLSGTPAVISYEVPGITGDTTTDPSAVIVNIKSHSSSLRDSIDSIFNEISSNSKRNSRFSNSNTQLNDAHAETEFINKRLEVRRVVQYHYTSWNDLQAPECTTGLLRFLSKLRKLDDYIRSPVVVHCSAGVGRTGTFIAIDSLLDQCIEEGKADVFGFVSEMRKQRNTMVQNAEQYLFIYKALAEWYMFGETDFEIDQFREHYRTLNEPVFRKQHASVNRSAFAAVVKRPVPKLQKVNSDISTSEEILTAMEAEYKRLERTLEAKRTCNFAHKPENVGKNRFENIVPFDHCRIVLPVVIGSINDSTYINASLVKGYFYPYILAQDPLDEQTCYDFWCMIGEQNSRAVVMLSSESEFTPTEKYWPSEVGRIKTFGRDAEVSIKLIGEELFSTFALRKFTYKFAKEKAYREVMQYAYLCWPADKILPESTESIIDLISRVLSLQSDHQEAGPIILHSRDGSFKTGLYCCVSLLLERLKAENRIDIFQTVRSLQQKRPFVFTSFEQYAFCYKAVIDYLDTFNNKGAII